MYEPFYDDRPQPEEVDLDNPYHDCPQVSGPDDPKFVAYVDQLDPNGWLLNEDWWDMIFGTPTVKLPNSPYDYDDEEVF